MKFRIEKSCESAYQFTSTTHPTIKLFEMMLQF